MAVSQGLHKLFGKTVINHVARERHDIGGSRLGSLLLLLVKIHSYHL